MAKGPSPNGKRTRKSRTNDEQISDTTITLLRQTLRGASVAVKGGAKMPPKVCSVCTDFIGEINEWLATEAAKPATDQPQSAVV